MEFPVLGETNGDVGGVSMFDRVSVLLIPFQDTLENEECPECEAIEIYDERFVRASGTEDVPDAFLRGNALRLLEEREGDCFDGIDFQWSTGACKFDFQFELFEEERYFCYYVIVDLNRGIHDNGRLKASVVIVVWNEKKKEFRNSQ